VPERVAFSRHQRGAEILLRPKLVVRAAAQSQVRGNVRALPGERLQMTHFEVARLATTLTSFIDVRAASAVPPIHLTSFRRWNVPATLARFLARFVWLDVNRDALARCF
jgi:hypothetical protein